MASLSGLACLAAIVLMCLSWAIVFVALCLLSSLIVPPTSTALLTIGVVAWCVIYFGMLIVIEGRK